MHPGEDPGAPTGARSGSSADRLPDPRPDQRQDQRVEQRLQDRLHRALRDGGLDVHFQPFVELATTAAVGVEALARWHDAELGSVPPTRFVAAAERSGQIVALGRLVLRRACEAAARLADPARPFSVSVNVSPAELDDAGFVAHVAATLRATGLAPGSLCLEITETAVIGDLPATVARLQELRALGVTVALDDFGTGYSSLTLLRQLPADVVKVDRAFVRNLTTDLRDAVLARLVVDGAHAMGLSVCAEGVETADQARQLVALGCDRAQGWFFARARDADDPALGAAWAARPLRDRPLSARRPAFPLAGLDELVLVTGPDGEVRFASAAARRLLDRSPGDLVGTPVQEHLTPDPETGMQAGTQTGTQAGSQAASQAPAGGLPEGTARYRVATAAGEPRWLQLSTQTRRAPTGEPLETLSVARDVTDTARAQRRLADSEELFRTAFDQAPTGMAMTTLEGRFLRVNAAYADLVGLTPDDVLRTTVDALTVEEDRETDRRNLDELRAGCTDVHDLRKRYRHADGHAVPARVRAALVTPDGAEPYIVAHVLPDEVVLR
ncbi:sensor domain-containing phosphodiesterase [Cellulomonas marina]|uniref:PAS domain S-box-containing protein n=1 Tax=Cellulomonas marina TaxID=988821 RepID=A0A1I0Z7U9_9CELL|nr:EAL domain-containing protein [Cellulomonas marina]GIG29045.1 hypothetical protein Cma02nite_16450 [Cellulomonas marina]SFB21694.1 PAS domain S-box-containing protein [Cellulomonas marina]